MWLAGEAHWRRDRWAPRPKNCFVITAESISYLQMRSLTVTNRQLPDSQGSISRLNFLLPASRQDRQEKNLKMKRRRYQYGCLTKKSNRLTEDVWQFRYYETTLEGHRCRRSTSVGTVAQYPTKAAALRVIEALRLRLNLHRRFGRPVSVGGLVDRYVEHELPERRHSTQQSHSSALNRWIRPRWGDYLLEQVKPVEVEEWLRSLPWRPKPRSIFAACFTLFMSTRSDGN